jgi:hypothetical protein
MPTSTSRGRCNWACSAALTANGPLLVVAGLCVVATAGTLLIVVCVSGVGVGSTVGSVGTGTELKVGVVGTGTVLTTVGVDGGSVAGGGVLTTVGVDGGSVFGSVFVTGGGGSLIVVGPPTGPVQTSPSGQHPMIPLLASSQLVSGAQQLLSLQQFQSEGQHPTTSHTLNPGSQVSCRVNKRPRIKGLLRAGV